MYWSPPREAYCPPRISVDDTSLNAVEQFTYLGSVISSDATVSKDLNNRLARASSAFGRLSKKSCDGPYPVVWFRKADQAVGALPSTLFRSILGNKWHDYVTNEEVLQQANLLSPESILLQQQLR
ncbi:hypothetical protein ACOMHN_001306 [Nucella lapillus]